ncbi:hypothetical protein AY599_09645 [Leptolyngbya valderiana BDU 20041]|nr:hypothetical protein AY599_09645 [Leptolyngbya valderiana BDU 20041]
MIRIGKVTGYFKPLSQFFMTAKFLAVIECQGFLMRIREMRKLFNRDSINGFCGFVFGEIGYQKF